jgi:hypothetical protein
MNMNFLLFLTNLKILDKCNRVMNMIYMYMYEWEKMQLKYAEF